ncbi:pituitary homeobox 1-like [Mercenaria mercenaria]|uniref:pituitary homeobox 1-like n=1 Tax=Mercenaria mercenaria TaxID=6596 RepID=UPI00234E4569|nr:pituitary homeobox 1-like [Mercenaria mercenaria]XP_053408748.1 pituitary homeobox 1-like [Mercenaria mercenaria]
MSEEENQHTNLISVSPIQSGTGNIRHNVTRMLEDSAQTLKSQLPSTSPRVAPYSPYSTAHFMSFRHNILHKNNLNYNTDISHEDATSDISNSDMSISTDGSVSPKLSSSITPPPPSEESSTIDIIPTNVHFSPLDETNSSIDSSPTVVSTSSRAASSKSSRVSNNDRVNRLEDNDEQPKKKARTNYTNEQVQTLLKIFHENPYPDSEMMEDIAKDLSINEKQVKIWFQNKRARWRRRVNDNKNNQPQSFLPMSPMLSPVTPYGFMPTGNMLTSSPLQNFPGYFNYPWMQGNNNQQLPGQISTNQIPPNYQTANHSAALQNQASSTVSQTPFSGTTSYAQYGRALPQQNITTNQQRYLFQYPGYMYTSV